MRCNPSVWAWVAPSMTLADAPAGAIDSSVLEQVARARVARLGLGGCA